MTSLCHSKLCTRRWKKRKKKRENMSKCAMGAAANCKTTVCGSIVRGIIERYAAATITTKNDPTTTTTTTNKIYLAFPG